MRVAPARPLARLASCSPPPTVDPLLSPSRAAQMRFLSDMWHPNIYPDGKVCISILHPPGVDRYNLQESADERWRPILGVEQVLVSVMSMLSEPNQDSPANIDAAKMMREDKKAFRQRVRKTVERSME